MTAGKEVATIKPIEEVRGALTKMGDQFKMVLPKQIDPDKFIRIVMTAVQMNPKLIEANRQSLYSACMRAATDGLMLDGREAALTIFGDQVQYMPMVGGILKKIRNSGELASIASQIIYKNDPFRFWIDGDGEHITHEPLMFGDRGEPIGVYALAKTKDGAVYIEVMDKAQVMAVKSVAKTKVVWEGAFAHEMWRKSAIRRLSKRLPMSTDLEQVFEHENENYDLEHSTEKAAANPTSSRLRNTIVEAEVVEAANAPSEEPI